MYKTEYAFMNTDNGKVELKNTLFVEFQTKQLINDSWQNVDADTYSAKLEDISLDTLTDLAVEYVDVGKYRVSFYADSSVVASGNAYFIAFYWEKDTTKMCERVRVEVVPDVQ